jgi:anti-anti-sigma regulatory factor
LSVNENDTQACVRTIQAPAQLDMESREDFRDRAVKVLEEMSPGGGCLIIDLATTHFVDTSAVGTLAQLQGKAAERRNIIRLRNANEEIKFALLLARMDELFEMDDPEGE